MFSNAYVLLLLATLGWGGNAVAGKLASAAWEPFTLTCLRWCLVVLVILPFAWRPMQQDKALIAKRWWFFLAAGGFGMALFNLLMFLALNYTTAINVSIEQASMPVFIIMANFLFLSQRVTALQIVGVIVSIAGVLVTTSNGDLASVLQNGLNKGDALMLMGCFFYAAYTFFLRWRPKVHWLTFICLIAIGAAMMSLPFAVVELQRTDFVWPDKFAWFMLLYIVIVPSIISQISFARSVELIGANRAGLFINLVPVFGSVLAVLIIGERFELFHAIGMVLVIGGIMFAERFALAENEVNKL